ncbi:MAG TPA: hypothetical protein VH021_24695, partial [Trebonia sp.]|nr:hypothetical protein [Trebonia sp.]
YQKLIEEAPAPGLDEDLRNRLRAAAVALGAHLEYRGAGTVEFLVDVDRDAFYFLEVNGRIQVEHPVTEAITGLDIVAEQIALAEGRPLRLRQDEVRFAGHAIECRINAEDPDHDFQPSPGTVTRAVFPVGGGALGAVRVDTHVQVGAAVPPYYDSLLAKVIAHGADRAGALGVLRGALDRCVVEGVATNLAMQREVLGSAGFAEGGVDTGYLGRWLARVTEDGDGMQAPGSVRDHAGSDLDRGSGRGVAND